MKLYTGIVLFCSLMLSSCSKEGAEVSIIIKSGFKNIALEFTLALTNRDYTKAYSMTAKEFRNQSSIDEMKGSFEIIVPLDWGTMGPVEVGETMTKWPDKKSTDLGWVYVSIGGDVYSEAIIAIVTLEGEELKVREVEYGRP